MSRSAPRIVIGISGASGAAIGVCIIELLAEAGGCELHLVVSHTGERTLAHECGAGALERIATLVARRHPIEDVGACIAGGSFRTAGMIVAPCSMRTLSAIAASAADNLLVRAADVQMKERRRLVLLARESPLHLGHLRAMMMATEQGAIIAPPVPAFSLIHLMAFIRAILHRGAGFGIGVIVLAALPRRHRRGGGMTPLPHDDPPQERSA